MVVFAFAGIAVTGVVTLDEVVCASAFDSFIFLAANDYMRKCASVFGSHFLLTILTDSVLNVFIHIVPFPYYYYRCG
jgi:hypothetical protein